MTLRYLSLFSGIEAGIPASSRLLTVIAAVFAVTAISGQYPLPTTEPRMAHPANIVTLKAVRKAAARKAAAVRSTLAVRSTFAARKAAVHKLAGPYAHLVMAAALKAHIPAKLVAAVVRVENGGNFHGSATRVSSAGAIGVMQLEPNTAWNLLRVNPWNARQNIEGGARYLAAMLHQFHDNVRLALMAYNAGPTFIAQGGRPFAAVAYANEVMRDAGEVRHA
ncbi:MAG: transglycosylase SLT domain-containing protein [Acidithiobacillus sp.]|uniref:transglycosylase SLT domain-containing protein n=1 Tax=Acidithiobacillus ferrooxidans TaxID=920 RepID=UPI001EF3BF50|nr:transglycosylase SLT domain-containing protein [Acidithiobacillus ferrooxidans]